MHTRQLSSADAPMSRLYVVESNYTITGSIADHRRRMRQADVERFTRALVEQLAARGIAKLAPLSKALQALQGGIDTNGIDDEFLSAVADDLVNNRGRSIVVAGSAWRTTPSARRSTTASASSMPLAFTVP